MANDLPDKRSPRVARLSWGSVTLEDGRVFKDVKLYPGGAREWDWTETGTRHKPGIQPEDVQEILRRGAARIVLSRGMWGRLGAPEATLEAIRAAGVIVEVCKTEQAVRRYNELAADQPVGALIHSTC